MSYEQLVESVDNLAEQSSQLKVAAQNVKVAAESSRDSAGAFAIDALASVTEAQEVILQAPLDAAAAAQQVLNGKVSKAELAAAGGSTLVGTQSPGGILRTLFEKLAEMYSIKDEGAVGDGTFYPVSDWYTPGFAQYRGFADLSAVQVKYPHVVRPDHSVDWAATQSAYNKAGTAAAGFGGVDVPLGVYVLNDTVNVKRFTTTIGRGRGSWYPVGRERVNPNEVLDMTQGSIFMFKGTPSSTYSTNRTETYFQNMRMGFLCEGDSDGIHFRNLKILCGFDIRDSVNNITTQLTDNSAQYDVLLCMRDGDDCSLDNVTIGGYPKTAGLLVDGSGRTATSPAGIGGIERFTINNCVIQGWMGLALIGGDEGTLPSATNPSGLPATGDAGSEGQWGMSHILVSNTHLFGENHHSNGFVGTQDEQYARQKFGGCALYVDGRVNGGGLVGRINNPRFVNVSIQTNESYGAIFDNCSRPSLVNFRCESRPILFTKNCILPQLLNCEIPYKRGLEVDRIYVTDKGSGYTTPPTVTVAAPTSPGGVTATATAVLAGDKVSYITFSGGSGYIVEPQITITGGGGSGAAARCIIARDFQSAEFCQGAVINPSIRRINNSHLGEYSFVIEFRNNAGVIEHRMGSTVGGLYSTGLESVMRFAMDKFPTWDYTAWTVSPQPASVHDFSKGIFLGPPGVSTKSAIYTPIAIEGISTTTQESRWHRLFADVVMERFTAADVTADCDFYGASAVDGRAPGLSGCLRVTVKTNGVGLSITDLPSEAAGAASLRLRVHGLMYPQIWGSL